MFNRFIHFFTHTLWTYNTYSYSPYQRAFIRGSQIFFSSLFHFYKRNDFLRVASLTYYSINSLVPLLAFMLWITARFAMHTQFEEVLVSLQPHNKEFIHNLFSFSANMLDALSNGWFLALGIGFLLWSVFSLMHNIDVTVNDVWGITDHRGFGKKVLIHFLIVALMPFIMLASISLKVALQKSIMEVIDYLELDFFARSVNVGGEVFLMLLSYAMMSCLLSLVYYIFPRRKMNRKPALYGGFIAGALFFLFEELYIGSQIGVSRASAIYGGFAASPLFFLWLYISWVIVLYGVHLCFHIENYPSFTTPKEEKISVAVLKKLCLYIYRSIEQTKENKTLRALHEKEIAKRYTTSIFQRKLALEYLIHAKLIEEYKPFSRTYCLCDLKTKYTNRQLTQQIEQLYADEIVLLDNSTEKE